MPREGNGQLLVRNGIAVEGRRRCAERRTDDESELFGASRRRRCHVHRDGSDEELFYSGLDAELERLTSRKEKIR